MAAAARALVRIALPLLCATSACTSVAGDLRTAQTLYKDARYEDAQHWLSELERETASMPKPELTRFYYLRGMTAFRLGQREDALHFLALADALCAEDGTRLPAEWQRVMERTLQEVMPVGASSHAKNPLRPDTT